MGWPVAGGIVALVLVLLAVDRMVARGWFDRRRRRPQRPRGSAIATGVLGDLVDVFQPNRVHLTAEQERQKLDIVQTGDAAGRLDLDSGVVHLDPGPPRDQPSRMSVGRSSLPGMTPVVSHLTIDSADPHALARWWSEVLGWSFTWEPADDEEEVGIQPPDGEATAWLFLKVPDVKSVKNRLHVDLRPPNGSDQATELERLLALGATRVDIGQGDVPWHVLADPEGNEFCLLRGTPDQVAAALAAEGLGT